MAPGSDKIASPLDRMELVIDDYGKNRYVESRHENGKLRVWYQYRSDGALLRHEHRGFGTFSDLADPLVFGSCARSVDTPVRTDASASETPFAVSGDADKSVRVPFVSAFR